MDIFSGSGFDDERAQRMSREDREKRFGQSAVFIDSTMMENGGVPQSATPETLLKEAIHVISCGYEDKSEWGTEVRCYLMLNYILYSAALQIESLSGDRQCGYIQSLSFS